MPAKVNKKHPSKHECMSPGCRNDKSKAGAGYEQLFEEGYVKIGLCHHCLKRLAPCDVEEPTEAAKDPRNYIEDGTHLGSCPDCGHNCVQVTMDVICVQCGEMWFWWEIHNLTAADVTSEARGVICQCPSCDGECFLVGSSYTAEAEERGQPRGLTGRAARQDVTFRTVHRQAFVHLNEAYMTAVEAVENLAAAQEALGEMTSLVADEVDALTDRDGNVHPQWPSDAFAYYNEQLGRAGGMREVLNSVAERINDIHRGLLEHNRRFVEKQ